MTVDGTSGVARTKRILQYIRPYWRIEFQILVCMVFGVVLALIGPLVFKILIDEVLVDRNHDLLLVIMVALVAIYLVRSVLSVITTYLYGYAGQKILLDLRNDLFLHLQRLDLGYFTKHGTGAAMARVNDDVNALQDVVSTTLISLVTDALQVLGVCVLLLWLDWKLACVSLGVFPVYLFAISYFGGRVRQRSRRIRESVSAIVEFLQERISGIRLIQSAVREEHEARRYGEVGLELAGRRVRLGVLGSAAAAVASFITGLGAILVMGVGGHRVMDGALTIGGLVAFQSYIAFLFAPVQRLAGLNVVIHTAMASVDRIFAFLDTEASVRDIPGATVLESVRGEVEFRSVHFAYDTGETVLENVSFVVQPGETIAIVGPSGAGKSTLFDLLCRFLEPTRGSVLIDGRDLRRVELKSLRRRIGLVSQDTFLFRVSIRENLRYGNLRATDAQIEEAARQACIHDFIRGLPEGYETIVGDRGLRLSGGEKQRLAIARAILRDPRILLLDEATSSLDSESEARIQRALEPLRRERTTLIIAHRLSTVVDADRILVLRSNQIAELGSHHELLQRDGVYKSLWEEQMGFRPISNARSPDV